MVVGLTGGIGAGKSTVCGMFEQLGAAVVDADKIAREVLDQDKDVIRAVGDAIDRSLIDSTGKVDRTRLAERVFSDAEARRQLEEIMHPVIAKRANDRIAELRASGCPGIIYEASLLVEAGRHQVANFLVVVVADEAVRLERLRKRGIDQDDARKRMAAQLPEHEKVSVADFVIDNNGTLEETREQVAAVWRKING